MQDALALNVTTEQGKTLADARGDVFRGLGELASTLHQSLMEGLMIKPDLDPFARRM